MKTKSLLLALLCSGLLATAQVTDPVITSWRLNTNGHTTGGMETDVQEVHYDSLNVYISASGVPYYYNPVNNNGNHNPATDQNAIWKLTRNPQPKTGTLASGLGGGQYGLFVDGTLLFNAEDNNSYMNGNVWHQLAYFFEAVDFDSTLGHSSPVNQYHHHVLDLAFVDTTVHNVHSPLIGYAFDGYPVYGPYGYTNPQDPTSGISRMTSSYALRNYTQRTTLPDGTTLQPSSYGPAMTGNTPLGCYREDYIYTAGFGTLDGSNGRLCKTPEYPNGTYAYFCTVDSLSKPRYPFTIGQTLYGITDMSNLGPQGGKATVPSTATLYVADTSTQTGIDETNTATWSMYPNPASATLMVNIASAGNFTIQVIDLTGRILKSTAVSSLGQQTQQLDLSSLSSGTYVVTVSNQSTGQRSTNKCVKM